MAFLFRTAVLLGSRTTPAPVRSYRHLLSRLSLRHLSLCQEKTEVSLKQGTDSVEINWSRRDDTTASFWNRFHYTWLRDNCQCPECYHPETNQRLLDTLKVISADLGPNWVELTDTNAESLKLGSDNFTALTVEWKDGHRSSYPLLWLQHHSYEQQGESGPFESILESSRPDLITWGKEISNSPPIVNYDSFMKDDRTYLEWSDKVDQYGFCFIDSIPLEPLFSKQVLERAGVLRNTFYGDFWDVEMNSKPANELELGDTAYTSLAIDSHTDGNYFHEAPGLQMLHIVHFNGTGGESILVDGFKLSEVIKEENPDHYHILSTVPLDYHYSDKNNRYLNSFVPFTVNPESGKVFQVHFNNCDRLPIAANTMQALHKVKPDGSIADIYGAIQTFIRAMRENEYQYRFRLEPGRAVIFDNHRVLHARTSFTERRRMCGGYVNREDWRSKVMTMARERLIKHQVPE